MRKNLTIKRILDFLPNKIGAVCSGVLIIIQAFITLIVPLLTMNIIDGMDLESLHLLQIGSLLLVFIGQVVFSGITLYVVACLGQNLVAEIRNKIWECILQLPIEYFDKNENGDLMSRINNDTHIVKEFIATDIYSILTGIISLIGSAVLLFVMDWKLALLMLVAIPGGVFLILPWGKKEYVISKRLQEKTAIFQNNMNRVLNDIRLVKSSTAYSYEVENGKRIIDDLRQSGIKEAKLLSFIQPMTSAIMILLIIVVIGYGALRIVNGTLTAGVLVASIFYLFQIASPISQLSMVMAKYQKFKSAFFRINEIFELPTESQLYYRGVRGEKSYLSNGNALCLQKITFRYDPQKEILQDINLDIEIGKTTAIVGSSGAGKTTIFSLIERFYLPEKGKIFYKGVDIEKIELNEWRTNLAYVQQEATVMSGTLYDNLTYGLTNISEDKIWDAIEKTHLTNFIHSLPDGLQTKVGERGTKLSGGQRQRIAIARAMIRDPKILLLDEATAHLDSISEGLVQNALNRLMEGRTTIIIAHRLSTIKNADKIYVLDRGRIIGQGTHKELIYSNEIYRSFIEQQNVG